MFRWILILIFLYMLWKVMRIISNSLRYRKKEDHTEKPFAHIEDAEYEDITHKPEQTDSTNQKKEN